MGMPVKVMLDGQPVFLCCKGCVKEAEEQPAKMLQRVNESKTKGGSVPPVPRASAKVQERIREALAKLSAADRALVEAQAHLPGHRRAARLDGRADQGGDQGADRVRLLSRLRRRERWRSRTRRCGRSRSTRRVPRNSRRCMQEKVRGSAFTPKGLHFKAGVGRVASYPRNRRPNRPGRTQKGFYRPARDDVMQPFQGWAVEC